MQKAHLYEALFLVNHGIDEAVSGVQRLKKAPGMFMETYHKSLAGLERRRALINGQFFIDRREREADDVGYFDEEYNRWLSDDPLTNEEIYKLMRTVERHRKLEGKPPLVQFLNSRKRKEENEAPKNKAAKDKTRNSKTKNGGRSPLPQRANGPVAA
jgi:hypothetical protein